MRRGVLVVAAVSIVAACATEADGLPVAARDDASLTPRITTPPDPPAELEALFLTEEDVEELDALANATATELADVPIFENPDPRGPCGSPVPALDLQGLGGRSFRAPRGILVEFVGELTPALRASFEAQADDSRPGCGAFESTTNTGDTQHVSNIDVLDLDGVADEAIGSIATIAVSGGETEAAVVFIIETDRVAFVQLMTVSRPSAAQVAALAQRAAHRLAGAGPTT